MAQTQVKNRVKPDTLVVEPPMFKVIYINDETTPMEFVSGSLVTHFDYTVQLANEKTQEVHNAGSAAVAVLPYEIAEQKGIEVTMSARSEGYPLMIKIEPSS